MMYKHGIDVESIADSLDVTVYTVKSAVRRMLESGNFDDKPRTGRKTKVSKRDMRHIKYHASRGLYSSAVELTQDVRNDFDIDVYRQRTSDILRQHGFKRFIDRVAPPNTSKWKSDRRKFYYDNLSTNWDHVAFTDEKTFRQKKSGRIKYYARSFEEFQEKHHRLPLRPSEEIKVWGAISVNGVGPLIRIPTSMKTGDYVRKILKPLLSTKKSIAKLMRLKRVRFDDFLWQQDNAPFHNGLVARIFFKKCNINVMRWPPYSPDLSPIENVWNIVQYRLRKRLIEKGSCKNLYKEIESIWYSITPAECSKLINSMPDRLNELYRREYNVIDY
jgi:transposase